MHLYQVSVVLLLCLINVVVESEESDYCYLAPCYTMNLACHNNNKIKECAQIARILNPNEIKNTLETFFNNLRNTVANGSYINLPTAACMAKMSWNWELTYLAKLDVSRCYLTPRPCIASSKFLKLGRLASSYGYPTDNTTDIRKDALESITEHWTKNIASIPRLTTLELPSFQDIKQMASSYLLILEHQQHFGCAALESEVDGYTEILLSCVFGAELEEGRHVYQWGYRPGNKCRKLDVTYGNLCRANEVYNANQKKRQMTYYRMPKRW